MANRNDEALRETLEYAVRNARKAKANGFRGQFALNLETLEALHDMLTQRPEPAEAMGGEDDRLRKVTKFALHRFMHDAYARANEAAQKASGKPAHVAERFLRDAHDAERAIAALSRPVAGGDGYTSSLDEDQVEWVVNDIAELGVKIGHQFFFLYKGRSLVYEDATHDDGTPMHWRPVFKREFGECCHPVNYADPLYVGTVSLSDSDDWQRLPATRTRTEGAQE